MSVRGVANQGNSFDPRYDRAFQRDVGSARDGAFRVSLDSLADSASTTASSTTSASSASPPFGLAPAGSWSTGQTLRDGGAASGDAPAETADAEAARTESMLRVRAAKRWLAYSVAIACVSGACMAFGVVLVVTAYGSFQSASIGGTAVDRMWPELAFQFGPWFFAIGLASAVGLLFLHASRWRPDRWRPDH